MNTSNYKGTQEENKPTLFVHSMNSGDHLKPEIAYSNWMQSLLILLIVRDKLAQIRLTILQYSQQLFAGFYILTETSKRCYESMAHKNY